ncbi:hypothetical protein ABK040_005849 [Willaertia magna]
MSSLEELEEEIQEFKIDKDQLIFGEKIGQGGFGFVCKGIYRDEVVAIKQLFIPEHSRTPRNRIGLSDHSDEDELWKETLNEIAVMVRLQHANVLNLFGWSTDPNCVYIVMEFMPFSLHKVLETSLPEYDYEPLLIARQENASQLAPLEDESDSSNNLEGIVKSRTSKLFNSKEENKKLTEEEKYKKFLKRQPILSNEMKLQIAIDIAEGMNHLHSRPKPIIHRDLKSQNVLLDANLTSKICDFGFASMRNKNSGVSGMKGTANFMAPEMYASAISSGEKADVYSYGMMIYELVTHLMPFYEIQNPFQVASQVICGNRPKIHKRGELEKIPIISNLLELMDKCCQQDPLTRPTFSQILHELRNIPLEHRLEFTVDLNGKGDFNTIQAAINQIPTDITRNAPKRPKPIEKSKLSTSFVITNKNLSNVSGSGSGSSGKLTKSNSFRSSSLTNTPLLGDNEEEADEGVMLGTNHPVRTSSPASGNFSPMNQVNELRSPTKELKQKLIMQKVNIPYTVRESDGRKIINSTRPLAPPIIKITPGIYREKLVIDKSVVLQGTSQGKSHAILYKPKDVDEVIVFDNCRYTKLKNLIIYNAEHKPPQPNDKKNRLINDQPQQQEKIAPCIVKLTGSKCDSTIENCTFRGVQIEICEQADPNICNNTIRDSSMKGVYIHSGAHGTIIENDIFGSIQANIQIEEGANPVIENNQIHNGLAEGIKITDRGLGNIVNNNIYSNNGSNIYVGAHADPLVFMNRLFTSESRGIEIAAFAKGKIRKNRLCGNKSEPQIKTVDLSKTTLKDNQILQLPSNSTIHNNNSLKKSTSDLNIYKKSIASTSENVKGSVTPNLLGTSNNSIKKSPSISVTSSNGNDVSSLRVTKTTTSKTTSNKKH